MDKKTENSLAVKQKMEHAKNAKATIKKKSQKQSSHAVCYSD
jgi:hypothetical protein